MYIKRHPQACVEIREKGKTLFIDPGEFGIPENLKDADAIFVTHNHFDHVSIKDEEVLESIKSGHIQVYGPGSLYEDAGFPVNVVKDGDDFMIGDVSVKVMGNWQDITSIYDPPIENVGYMIEDRFLHPGDALPKFRGLPIVAGPMAAPWAKNSDIEKYLEEYRPKGIFPLHDVTLNDMGIDFAMKNLETMANRINAICYSLKVGEDAEI